MAAATDGSSMFEDVFRRADKNDDGSLSVDEFADFFCDGVLSESQLAALFNAVDADNSGTITTDELSAYFKSGWGSFRQVFAALETLNVSIANALTATATQKNPDTNVAAFNRFYLSEVTNTMSKMQMPLEQAQNALRTLALSQLEAGHEPHQIVMAAPRASQGVASRARDCEGTARADGLSRQVERLAQLLGRLERKVELDTVDQEQVNSVDDDIVVLVSRTAECTPGGEQAFHKALRAYQNTSTLEVGCVNVCLRVVGEGKTAVVYEVWADQSALDGHHVGAAWKAWRRETVECLASPEVVKTINIPDAWITGAAEQ